MPDNSLADGFTQRNFVADFLRLTLAQPHSATASRSKNLNESKFNKIRELNIR